MTTDEAAPISDGPPSPIIEGARSKGSLLEEDDASSVEEKKEVSTDEGGIDDTSVPLVNSGSSFDDEDSNVEDVDNGSTLNTSDSKEDNVTDGEEPCPRWADVLSTPSNAAVFTPSADINSLKQNMHGWGK